MSRSPLQVLSLTFMIQPAGWALPADPASNWGGLLLPMATLWSNIEASMANMLPQVDPRAAVELLPAWEQMLGPDPCGRDLTAITLSQRQKLAYQRYTARGGQSIPTYIALAASLGETITIQEGSWCRCGAARCNANPLSAPGNQFNWLVNLPQTDVTLFRCGASQCGDRLGSFTAALSQCPISHAAASHTIVAFNYSGTETD